MLISSASFAAVAVASIGVLVFWSNPSRVLNRLFFSFSVLITAWLVCVHHGVSLGEDPKWVRAASAIGAFGPLHMWLIKEACIGRHLYENRSRIFFWTVASMVLAMICYSPSYVVPAAGGGARPGAGYLVYMVI